MLFTKDNEKYRKRSEFKLAALQESIKTVPMGQFLIVLTAILMWSVSYQNKKNEYLWIILLALIIVAVIRSGYVLHDCNKNRTAGKYIFLRHIILSGLSSLFINIFLIICVNNASSPSRELIMVAIIIVAVSGALGIAAYSPVMLCWLVPFEVLDIFYIILFVKQRAILWTLFLTMFYLTITFQCLVIADTFLKRYIYEKTMGEQHATILKLYESEKKYNEKIEVYQKVLEQSPVSVVITDTEGKIEYVNPYFSELTGYQLEEVLGKNPRILKSGKTDSAKYMELWKKLKNGEEWRGEFVNLNKENQEYEESAIITPIKNADNHVTHYVSIGENITQRKQKEQELQNALIRAEEAAVAKSLFLANMSHEIRTPMNAVIGMAYLALQTDLSKKQADYISKIHKAATSLLGILNDILDFSKIEAEKLELECEEFNLDSTVLEAIGLTTQAGYEKGLEFIYHLSPEIPKQLLGDSLRLRQVIANLVSNAVKFTQKGKITIDIKMIGNTVKNTGEKIQLIFSVVDTGIGIAEADLKKLFEAFSQTDNSMTKRFGGTGLGLAICKKLVSLMEGEIWVESIPKKGSIFSFSASFKIADTCKEECCVFPSEIHNKRILIVGDSNEERYILAEYLKAMDFQTEEASSAREAENFIKEADQTQFYDIVLVDWKMERMNGLELIRKINRELGLFHVPKVILLTSCNREDIREQAGDISIHNILVKPIGQSMLYNAIVNIYLAEKKNTDTKVRVDTDICCLDKISVLLVEDNEVNRQIASELLESQGMIVEIAQNGLEAVHKVENMPAEAPYHLILMDLQMPKMDGFEATRQIRKKNIQIPIIAMTARTLLEEQKECYKAGMNDHISKPIDIDLLFQTIERWIPSFHNQDSAAAHEKQLSDEKIISIEGIDSKKGLKRLAGNQKLYKKLLIQYAESQDMIMGEISSALQQKEYGEIEKHAHSLKGVSGNIAAEDVWRLSQKLETAVKDHENEKNIIAIVEELENVTGKISKNIREMISYETQTQTITVSDTVAKENLLKLLNLLRENSFEAMEFFLTIQNQLHLSEEDSAVLSRNIKFFEYDEAIKTIENAMTV